MKRKWILGIAVALALALVGLCGCGSGNTVGELSTIQLSSQQQGVWVTGLGEVTAVPDIATLRLGIEAQAATVAEARSQAAEAMDRVMTSLKDNGIAEKDIQTQYFNISQVTEWDRIKEEEEVIGYRVTNTVTAKIREIDKAGVIIDAAAEAGGDLTRVNGISFSLDDPSAYYEEAREKAMADAEAKAEQLAKLGGVSLGKPTYISESVQTPAVIYRDVVMEAAIAAPVPTTPISPGELEISLTIQVAYAISN
jgi:uncharacterized protein YggE